MIQDTRRKVKDRIAHNPETFKEIRKALMLRVGRKREQPRSLPDERKAQQEHNRSITGKRLTLILHK
jgi:uncharacterized protein YneF (UPF0154 family)